jgi:hypothetical protein
VAKSNEFDWRIPENIEAETDEMPDWDEPAAVKGDDWGITLNQDKNILREAAGPVDTTNSDQFEGKMLKIH